MPRSNSSVPRHRRHRKIVKLAKGYFGARSRNFKAAKDAVTKAGQYAYRDRRRRKRDFRSLWISRINAAVRELGLSYSRFIDLLNKNSSGLNRKVLSDLCVNDPESFRKLVDSLKN